MSQRIKVLDVMRGFTMMLVVFQHVRIFSMGLQNHASAIGQIFLAFRMPMFFFISGFVAYKAIDAWSPGFWAKRIWKKALVELVPTVFFFYLFITLCDHTWSFPNGYWFTVALFYMLAAYFTIAALCRAFHCAWAWRPVMAALAVGLFCLMPSLTFDHYMEYRLCRFFPYFVLGLLCRSWGVRFFKTVENRWFTTAIILTAIGVLVVQHLWRFNSQAVHWGLEFLGSTTLLLTIFAAFFARRAYWQQDGKLSRIMQFVGRRTLDIYMIHYFLLPKLPQLHSLFSYTGNDVIEAVIVGAITIAITAGCIAIGAVLRTSPFLAKWLFGTEPKKKITANPQEEEAQKEPKPGRIPTTASA